MYIIEIGGESNTMEFQWNIITKHRKIEIEMISVYIGLRVSFVCDFRAVYFWFSAIAIEFVIKLMFQVIQ